MLRKGDLTQGGITTTLLQFTLPMLAGSLLQQCYNIADTLIVGQCIGANALAAVGSAYTLMVFLISILLGLSMGSGTVFSLQYGAGDLSALRRSIYVSFLLIGTVTILLNVAVFLWLDPILRWLQVPYDIYSLMRNYLWIIFWGIVFTFLYNFYAALLRAVGDSVTPLWFLAVSVVLNIGLDLFLILVLDQGIEGAAVATVIAQGTAASGILLYTYKIRPELRLHREDMRFDRSSLREITSFSTLTCVQQSVMNFGILMVQGLVNSFGTVVMAAFAAAVKIDSFAYMPVQEFGNAFSTFIAQNFGARKGDRIRRGVRSAFLITIVFSLIISLLVFFFAKPLMLIFVRPDEAEILRIGTEYLRIEGVFLFRHRNLVPPLWLLPGHPYAGNVCRAYHSVFRYTCRPFLLAGIHSHYWGHRYLVVYSYRLVSSRLSRHCLLPLSQICSLTDLTKIRLRYTFITGFFYLCSRKK